MCPLNNRKNSKPVMTLALRAALHQAKHRALHVFRQLTNLHMMKLIKLLYF